MTGIDDLRHQRQTVAALLVAIGAPKLRSLGVEVPDSLPTTRTEISFVFFVPLCGCFYGALVVPRLLMILSRKVRASDLMVVSLRVKRRLLRMTMRPLMTTVSTSAALVA